MEDKLLNTNNAFLRAILRSCCCILVPLNNNLLPLYSCHCILVLFWCICVFMYPCIFVVLYFWISEFLYFHIFPAVFLLHSTPVPPNNNSQPNAIHCNPFPAAHSDDVTETPDAIKSISFPKKIKAMGSLGISTFWFPIKCKNWLWMKAGSSCN